MFRAVREMWRKPVTKLTIHDEARHMICNTADLNALVTNHFRKQFSDPTVEVLPAFAGRPSRLAERITPGEDHCAMGKLNSGRASGYENKPATF